TGTIQATNLLGGATSLSTDAQGNIIRTPSDERLKTDITTIEGALLKVLSLRGVTYSWQDTERFGDQKEIGFLAQEVELILPEAVRKGGEYWSLNTSNIVAVVVEAVKELWSTLENQQEKIDALEARVQYLESHSGGTQQPGDVGYTEVEIKEIAPEGATEEQNNPEESATDPVTLEPASLPIETNEEQVPVSVEISN
ncbi:MAG: hypothetical protein RLZZ76_511, partial [Candidatus Parcubacteria bacterium]